LFLYVDGYGKYGENITQRPLQFREEEIAEGAGARTDRKTIRAALQSGPYKGWG
jgi:hypothetical protein